MRVPRRPLSVGLAVLSAVLLYLASEPLALAPLAWVALVPLFVAILRERRWRWGFAYGLITGCVYLGLHWSWIFIFGWMAWVGLTLAAAAYIGAAGLAGTIVRRWPLAPVLLAGSFVGFELLRDRWPFGGYPWGALGTSQGAMPGVRWMAGSIGAYGLSFLCAFAAAVIADRIVHRSWAVGSLALVLAGVGLFAGVDAWRYGTPPPADPIAFTVVQGSVPPGPGDVREAILASHVELTREALSDGPPPDVVVWPEDAIGIGAPSDSMSLVASLARRHDLPFLVGRSEANRSAREFVNTVVHVTPEGTLAGAYTKRHPVPFGEYVPLSFLRRFVGTLEQVPYDLVRGDHAGTFEIDGTRIATPICFESVFPRDFRDFARRGAEVFVLATNNTSFEDPIASDQHLAHTRMRSLELRQWTVQAALSGKSAVLSPDGTITETTELYERTTFTAELGARPAHSLFARVGDLFSYLWAGGTAVAIFLYGGLVLRGRVSRGEEASVG